MKSPFYRIFVGHYEKPVDAKSDMTKLRELELKPSIFKIDDAYSILITAALKQDVAENILANLIKRGYDAFLSEPER